MFTFINLLKNFENKISQTEIIETQYSSREHFQIENFHLISFTKSIMSKIKESSNLITILYSNVNEIKNEVLNQINSNFSNHLILISKIKTVDYLLENVEKPLISIRNKIQKRLSILDMKEIEIRSLIDYFHRNELSLNSSKLSSQFFKLYYRADKLLLKINRVEECFIFKNIFQNNENISIVIINDLIRRYLNDVLLFFTLNDKLNKIKIKLEASINHKEINYENSDKPRNKFIYEGTIDKFNQYISQDDIFDLLNRYILEINPKIYFVDKLLEKYLSEIIAILNLNKKVEVLEYKSIIKLLFYCYKKNKRLKHFYEKIKEYLFIIEINKIFCFEGSDKSFKEAFDHLTIMKKFEIFEESIKDKYSIFVNICEEKYDLNMICIINPIIEKFNNIKNLLRCLEPHLFWQILNLLIEFINKYPINREYYKNNYQKEQTFPILTIEHREDNKNSFKAKNDDKRSYNNEFSGKDFKIKLMAFFNNFSYFTYFQFMQNNIGKIILESGILDLESNYKNINYDVNDAYYCFSKIIKIIDNDITCLSNLLFNFTNHNELLFKEKKIFLRNIPNYLNFTYANLNLISNKIFDLFTEENTSLNLFFKATQNLTLINKFDSEKGPHSYQIFKNNINEFAKKYLKYLNFINNLNDLLIDIICREGFIYENYKEIELLKSKILKTNQTAQINNISQKILESNNFKIFIDLDKENKQTYSNILRVSKINYM